MRNHSAETAAALRLIARLLKLEGRAPSRPTNNGTTQRSSLQIPRKMVRDETHRADAFPPRLACRRDRYLVKRPIGPAFHRTDLDRAKMFQTNQIVISPVSLHRLPIKHL